MRKRKEIEPQLQLSLFENNEPAEFETPIKEPSVLEFLRARFEYGPDMTQEEYKRWIKVLVNSSLRSIK
jgi:hypothetical protein